MVESAGALDQYPDPQCRGLVRALAEHEGVPEDCILCGSGAAELIYSYCAAVRPRRALELAPTFSEYASALEAAGCRVERWNLRSENGFALGADFPEALAEGTGTRCSSAPPTTPRDSSSPRTCWRTSAVSVRTGEFGSSWTSAFWTSAAGRP